MDRKICLDTSVLINLLKGDEKIKEKLMALEGNFCTTSINVFELWFGRKSNEKIFELIKSLEIYDFDEKSAKLAAEIMRKLKKEGKFLEIRDIFISSICINNDLELFTLDKHFKRLKKFGLILI